MNAIYFQSNDKYSPFFFVYVGGKKEKKKREKREKIINVTNDSDKK